MEEAQEDGQLVCFGRPHNSKRHTMTYWGITKAYIGMRMPLGFNLDQFQANA